MVVKGHNTQAPIKRNNTDIPVQGSIDQEEDNRTRRSMDHIEKNHMFNGKQGKSLFTATDRWNVWALIQETLINPDRITKHRRHAHRCVYKKSFASPVGVDCSGASCYFVTVIYDQRSSYVVTAYPTV